MSSVKERNLLPLTSNDMCALRNPFVNKVATPEQRGDLLTFRKISQKEWLHTLSESKVTKGKLSSAEKEKNVIAICFKSQA